MNNVQVNRISDQKKQKIYKFFVFFDHIYIIINNIQEFIIK